jgi:hypothetical protein
LRGLLRGVTARVQRGGGEVRRRGGGAHGGIVYTISLNPPTPPQSEPLSATRLPRDLTMTTTMLTKSTRTTKLGESMCAHLKTR